VHVLGGLGLGTTGAIRAVARFECAPAVSGVPTRSNGAYGSATVAPLIYEPTPSSSNSRVSSATIRSSEPAKLLGGVLFGGLLLEGDLCCFAGCISSFTIFAVVLALVRNELTTSGAPTCISASAASPLNIFVALGVSVSLCSVSGVSSLRRVL